MTTPWAALRSLTELWGDKGERQRRKLWRHHKKPAVAVLILFVVTVGLHISFLSPVREANRLTQERIVQEKHIIAKYRDKLREAETLKERLLSSQQELESLKAKLFPSADPYQLTAKLEEFFSVGSRKDVIIKSYQITSTTEYGLYQEVQYTIAFDMNIYGLSQFLSWLNTYATSVGVRELNVRYAPRDQKENSVDLIVNVIFTVLMQKKG